MLELLRPTKKSETPECLRCSEPGVLILWGKLAEPAHRGPHCERHTEEHLGWEAMRALDTWAVHDLRSESGRPLFCRECRDTLPHGASAEQAVLVVWGPSFVGEALGPKCWAHARRWTSPAQREGRMGVYVLPGVTLPEEAGEVAEADVREAVEAALQAAVPSVVASVVADLRAAGTKVSD